MEVKFVRNKVEELRKSFFLKLFEFIAFKRTIYHYLITFGRRKQLYRPRRHQRAFKLQVCQVQVCIYI